MNYDERNPFVVCAIQLVPIYRPPPPAPPQPPSPPRCARALADCAAAARRPAPLTCALCTCRAEGVAGVQRRLRRERRLACGQGLSGPALLVLLTTVFALGDRQALRSMQPWPGIPTQHGRTDVRARARARDRAARTLERCQCCCLVEPAMTMDRCRHHYHSIIMELSADRSRMRWAQELPYARKVANLKSQDTSMRQCRWSSGRDRRSSL